MIKLNFNDGVRMLMDLNRGMQYEDALFKMSSSSFFGRPVTNILGGLDLHRFRDVAKMNYVRDSDIYKTVGKYTGMHYEDVYREMNMPKIAPLKNILSDDRPNQYPFPKFNLLKSEPKKDFWNIYNNSMGFSKDKRKNDDELSNKYKMPSFNILNKEENDTLYLKKTKNRPYEGLLHSYTFTKKSDNDYVKPLTLNTYNTRKLEPLKDFSHIYNNSSILIKFEKTSDDDFLNKYKLRSFNILNKESVNDLLYPKKTKKKPYEDFLNSYKFSKEGEEDYIKPLNFSTYNLSKIEPKNDFLDIYNNSITFSKAKKKNDDDSLNKYKLPSFNILNNRSEDNLLSPKKTKKNLYEVFLKWKTNNER